MASGQEGDAVGNPSELAAASSRSSYETTAARSSPVRMMRDVYHGKHQMN
jgi:hypothetical protein